VHDLAYLLRLQCPDRLNGMDHLMKVHLFRCVVEIVNQMHRLGVEKMDVLQIRDVQNRDAVLTFLDAVRHFLVNLADALVGEELRHLLKMDCYLDVVGVELHHL
jgi:DNA-binding FrmR family transcriptional regulator